MKAEEYYKRHGKELQDFIASDAGKDLIVYLQSVRPQFQPLSQEHLLIELYGSIRGYEQCLKNIIAAAIPRAVAVQPIPTYGVEKPPEPPPFIPDSQPQNK